VVAPGFIDTHFHALDGLSSCASVRDGVTTGMDLELGAMNVEAWYAAKEEGQLAGQLRNRREPRDARMIVHDGLEFSEPTDATRGFELRAKAQEDGVDGPPG
jgi:N-acyl-D-amino-acid deacylase